MCYYMRMLDTNSSSQNSSVLGASVASGSAGLSGLGLAAGGGAANTLGGGHHVNNTNNNNNGILGASMHTQLNGGIGGIGGTTIGSTGDRLDASSDSAVSSMGSERVPSLSDSEWGDGAGSDSAQEYHQRNSSKYGIGPYDYSYSRGAGGGDASRHPVAQKKHQMFGKRYFQEQTSVPSLPQSAAGAPQPNAIGNSIKYELEPYGMHSAMPHNSLDLGAVGVNGGPILSGGGANKFQTGGPQLNATEMKYSCSLDFARQSRVGPPNGAPNVHDLVSHNHTYTLPHGSGASPRPQARDKKQRKLDDEHLSRDEKRARSLSIPMPVQDIINLPMDEFNERLSKYDLSESQLSLIRDIRRRGKNKVAAQNCRKRKLDQIICLADEVKEVRERKERIYRDREMGISSNEHIKRKFSMLHKHIFMHLRDADGNLYSPSEFSLQQSHDGSVHILRKDKDAARNGSNGAAGSSASSSSSGHHSGHHHHHHHAGGSQGPSSQHHHSQHPHHPHHPHHPKD